MTHSNKSISLLRQRMIEDMTLRKLAPKTQAGYLRAVIKFTFFFGRSPDLASPEDLRTFQLQQVEQGVSSTTINATLIAGTAAGLVTARSCDRQDAARRLVVPGTQPGEPSVDPTTQSCLSPRSASCQP
jgi:hypothetical protein